MIRHLRTVVALMFAIGLVASVTPAPAGAGTPYVDGISDQDMGQWSGTYQDASGLFDTPFYDFFTTSWVGGAASHIHYARFVTAPDAVAQGGACQQNLRDWFTFVTARHLIPVIAVWNFPEGGCVNNGLPSTDAYATDVQQLLGYLDGLGDGTVPYIEAWNEPNSSGVSASAAAAYWSAANTVCATAGCTAIAGDFVDNDPDQGGQAFAPGCAAGLTYDTHFAPYEDAYVAALGSARPAIWGLHPYYAVNCEQSASVTTFEAHLPTPAGETWFTEVGAWECRLGQSPPRGTAQQQADASYLVNTLMSPTSPTAPAHVFYYEIAPLLDTQACSKYADSALYEATSTPGSLTERPAAATIYGADTTLAADTGPATGVRSTQATFTGTVTPGGIYEASVVFRYGTTPAYGSQTAPVHLTPGLDAQAVSATVDDLTPNTPYYYQVVATDTNGLAATGADALMAPVLLSASASRVLAGTALTVSWSGVSEPSAGDWVGLYQPGAPASAPAGGFYAGSCGPSAGPVAPPSGTCSFRMPSAPGTYELRLYASAAADLLTSSGQLTSIVPAPVNTAVPQLAGADARRRAHVGDTLVCSPGTWSNAPTSFAYAWSADGAPVPGATGGRYLVRAGDASHGVSCTVTASNDGGAGSPAVSATVTAVPRAPNTVLLATRIDARQRTATFRLRATGVSNGLRCSLTRRPSKPGATTPGPHYAACASPKTFTRLAPGGYVLYARAVGPGGADRTPVIRAFTVP